MKLNRKEVLLILKDLKEGDSVKVSVAPYGMASARSAISSAAAVFKLGFFYGDNKERHAEGARYTIRVKKINEVTLLISRGDKRSIPSCDLSPLEVFLSRNEKAKRVIDVIDLLQGGVAKPEIAKQKGMTWQGVKEIESKYLD